MTTVRIIPCLDVDGTVVVKGIRFLDLKRKGDPVEMAQRYEELGADELVFLDVTATVSDRRPFYNIIREVASTITIPFTVGGGVKTVEDVGRLLDSGADKVSINTTAVMKPSVVEEAAREYGSQAVVVAIDAKKVGDGWEVYVAGGRRPTGVDAVEWARRAAMLGAGELLVTSIDRDGTRLGYDLELLKAIIDSVRVPVIASGGAGELRHFYEAYKAGATGLLAAGLFHDGILTPLQVKEYLQGMGVEVRL